MVAGIVPEYERGDCDCGLEGAPERVNSFSKVSSSSKDQLKISLRSGSHQALES